ncbi:MAG: zinc-dependent alcohol dehydrogenase family protein [Myxococcota bacterium]
MRAMLLKKGETSLRLVDISAPKPDKNQLLIKVETCGICRTDLHIVDGELKEPKLPLIPGHQIVGSVVECGAGVVGFAPGDMVGVPWLGWSCGECKFCKSGRENLCNDARYTGYQIDGGFAEMCVAEARFAFRIPTGYPALQAAPLLCAGLIGYRALKMTGEGRRLGFYGFGAAAHILTQVARYQGREVYAFTREGDSDSQRFAESLGAVWVGGSEETPPHKLDAAIIFAPVGALLPIALKAVDKGGVVICAGIYMSDIPSFPYSILWEEREVKSVANLTRRDGEEFLELAPQVPIKTEVTAYPLEKANEALDDLRAGRFKGAAVLKIADNR